MLATLASELTLDGLDAFAIRFAAFDRELRNHSEVEDGIVFPAIVARCGRIDPAFGDEHGDEQRLTYRISCRLLHAKAERSAEPLARLASDGAMLRDALKHHLAAEETEVLSQVDGLFTASEQADLLGAVATSLPADPRLQPWVAAALSPDHLEARLRNMAVSLPPAALTTVLTQIHDGVDAGTWAVVRARTPELASIALAAER